MDEVFEQEQAHLSEVYAKLEEIREALTADLETDHAGAAQDLIDMSEEIRLNFNSADETMETLAAIETLNSVIDAYNQYHDIKLDELKRAILLLRQPYFAKVTLKMRPDRPPRDVDHADRVRADEGHGALRRRLEGAHPRRPQPSDRLVVHVIPLFSLRP